MSSTSTDQEKFPYQFITLKDSGEKVLVVSSQYSLTDYEAMQILMREVKKGVNTKSILYYRNGNKMSVTYDSNSNSYYRTYY